MTISNERVISYLYEDVSSPSSSTALFKDLRTDLYLATYPTLMTTFQLPPHCTHDLDVACRYEQQALRSKNNISPTADFKGSSTSRYAACQDTSDRSPSKVQPSLLNRLALRPSEVPIASHTGCPNDGAVKDTSGWTTAFSRTTDSGWSTTSPSVHSVQAHGHSRSSSQASSVPFDYGDCNVGPHSSDCSTSVATSTPEPPTTETCDDDGWGSWKPKVSAEQEGAAAYRQRCMKKPSFDAHPGRTNARTSPPNAIHSNIPSDAFERNFPPQSAKSAERCVTSQAPLSTVPSSLGSATYDKLTQKAIAGESDEWSAWTPSAKPTTGEEAFRKRQQLKQEPLTGSISSIHTNSSSDTQTVVNGSVRGCSTADADDERLASQVKASQSGHITSIDGNTPTSQESNDPWAAWSATPQKDEGGADAFRSRQAMGFGERLSNAPTGQSSASQPSRSNKNLPQSMSIKAGASLPTKPVPLAQLPNFSVTNANLSPAGSQSSTSTIGSATHRSKTSGAARRRRAADRAALAAAKPSNVAIAENRACEQAKLATVQIALNTVSNALEDVGAEIAASHAIRKQLSLDTAVQVPEESLVNLTACVLDNIMDAVEPEQNELLEQLQGLSFETKPHSSAGALSHRSDARVDGTQAFISLKHGITSVLIRYCLLLRTGLTAFYSRWVSSASWV